MQLTFKEYKDKVRACWLGKNIGGTLGAPFECIRGVYDLEYYTHDLALGVLPNDDLDLQLVWLNAAEKYGKSLNADILGEYWLAYVTADWSEYGAAKNNLRYGLCPPISGWYHNHNKDSCGCFIRSEIWACLAPGHPEIAVKYAYEDAICDHADEGMYGEIFCAALQSAAFVESNREKLIHAALSFIPKNCAIARVTQLVKACYEKGLTWKEARKAVLHQFTGSFGMYYGYKDQEPEDDIPDGELGYDTPSNIGLMMIGWYYGEGDFSKSICIAAGCCEDGDCTAGTLASVLGIIGGTAAIDEKWLAPIGDEIKIISVDVTDAEMVPPRTVTELTDRVIRLMPVFMHGFVDWNEAGEMIFKPVENIASNIIKTGTIATENYADIIGVTPVTVRKSNCLFDMQISYDGDLSIRAGEPKKFYVKIKNNLRKQQWLECKLHLPEDWTAQPGEGMCINLDQAHGGCSVTRLEFEIIPQTVKQGRYDILLEIKSAGRLNKMFLEIPLLNG